MGKRLQASVKARRFGMQVNGLLAALQEEHGPNGPRAVREARDVLEIAVDKLYEAAVILEEYEQKPLYQVFEALEEAEWEA